MLIKFMVLVGHFIQMEMPLCMYIFFLFTLFVSFNIMFINILST